ncbi:MAG: nicotinate (nicotinamide) nucleotide adenylyltransferase [Candidatus Kapabacteria bacterium]|nr:nicotinate (nicotinamide) nucleotide adenylyltransferase [Candidatus Kapabacteria bacterium]
MEKIGIFGGTFNPVHKAHLKIAEIFTEQLNLNFCFFVPAFISPFKANSDNKTIMTAKHRLAMLKAAIGTNKQLFIEDYETNRSCISYTIDTINYFHNKFPDSQLFLLIGSDQFYDFQKWKDYNKILDLVDLCIASRPGEFLGNQYNKYLDDLFLKSKPPIILENELMDISASEIRRRISMGEPFSELVPDVVEDYIIRNRLYL